MGILRKSEDLFRTALFFAFLNNDANAVRYHCYRGMCTRKRIRHLYSILQVACPVHVHLLDRFTVFFFGHEYAPCSAHDTRQDLRLPLIRLHFSGRHTRNHSFDCFGIFVISEIPEEGVAAMAVTQSRTHSSLYILYTTHYYILGKKREVRKKSRKLFCHISLTVDKSLFALYNTSRYFKVGPVRPPRTAILRYQYAYFTRLSLTESRVFRFSERYQNKRRADK